MTRGRLAHLVPRSRRPRPAGSGTSPRRRDAPRGAGAHPCRSMNPAQDLPRFRVSDPGARTSMDCSQSVGWVPPTVAPRGSSGGCEPRRVTAPRGTGYAGALSDDGEGGRAVSPRGIRAARWSQGAAPPGRSPCPSFLDRSLAALPRVGLSWAASCWTDLVRRIFLGGTVHPTRTISSEHLTGYGNVCPVISHYLARLSRGVSHSPVLHLS
jgi:hypothetical protein